MIQVGPSFSSGLGPGLPGIANFGGRKRRQSGLSNFHEPIPNLSMSENDLLLASKVKEPLDAFKNMDPVYVYSFYVAWVG